MTTVRPSMIAGGTARPLIGRDLLPVGRLVRVLAGLLNLAAAAGIARLSAPFSALEGGGIVLAFLVAAGAYTLGIWLLGDRLLRGADPWLAAMVLVAPLAVPFVLPFVPDSVTIGLFLYVGGSQLVQAVIAYGGCEIAAIPSLLLRRRYTIYCSLNGVDLVERWLPSQRRWVAWCLALLAFAITTALGALAQLIGQAAGFFAAYLAFLSIGFLVGRIIIGPLATTPRRR
ncbi:MAG: hypothetical protein LBJ87_03595 [bacterium]|jgi:hypothetical protein|nr:hypothetical protein [bacterium]